MPHSQRVGQHICGAFCSLVDGNGKKGLGYGVESSSKWLQKSSLHPQKREPIYSTFTQNPLSRFPGSERYLKGWGHLKLSPRKLPMLWKWKLKEYNDACRRHFDPVAEKAGDNCPSSSAATPAVTCINHKYCTFPQTSLKKKQPNTGDKQKHLWRWQHSTNLYYCACCLETNLRLPTT